MSSARDACGAPRSSRRLTKNKRTEIQLTTTTGRRGDEISLSLSPRVTELTDGARPDSLSRDAHDRELTVVHTHAELTERKCRVSLARARPGGDLSPHRRRYALAPPRRPRKSGGARAVKSVATGDHVTPSRRRVPLGSLSRLARDAAGKNPLLEPTIASWLSSTILGESSAIRREAGRFDRSTLSIRVVARTGGNLSETTTAWLRVTVHPPSRPTPLTRGRGHDDSKSRNREGCDEGEQRPVSLSREGETELPLRSTRWFLKELSAPALLRSAHDTACTTVDGADARVRSNEANRTRNTPLCRSPRVSRIRWGGGPRVARTRGQADRRAKLFTHSQTMESKRTDTCGVVRDSHGTPT